MLERFALSEAIARLAARERMVVSLRISHGLTQQKCAGILGISQVQVSRLERRALDALRELLKTAGPERPRAARPLCALQGAGRYGRILPSDSKRQSVDGRDHDGSIEREIPPRAARADRGGPFRF
jgi:transcriptional regulator with XRE-family HTH domain